MNAVSTINFQTLFLEIMINASFDCKLLSKWTLNTSENAIMLEGDKIAPDY